MPTKSQETNKYCYRIQAKQDILKYVFSILLYMYNIILYIDDIVWLQLQDQSWSIRYNPFSLWEAYLYRCIHGDSACGSGSTLALRRRHCEIVSFLKNPIGCLMCSWHPALKISEQDNQIRQTHIWLMCFKNVIEVYIFFVQGLSTGST